MARLLQTISEDVILNYNTDRSRGEVIYNSEWPVTADLTQIYGYMIESGLEYNYLGTVKAFVFLWIKENELHILYYHFIEPNLEADGRTRLTFCFVVLR